MAGKTRRYFTTREIMDTFHVTFPTVKRWIKAGLLPEPIQPGKKFLFDRAGVETLMAGGKTAETAD
jgi:predicted site-specific integrase-resolvase